MAEFDQVVARGLKERFDAQFGPADWREYFFVQAPGRTEVSGNHTDHQGGSVIAAAVNRAVQGVFAGNETNVINLESEGHSASKICLDELAPRDDEKNSSTALIRGMAAQFAERGFTPKGFDATLTSTVAAGSGLSSSAAFEIELGQAMNVLWAKGVLAPEDLALMAQRAEHEWFGKPCGLMDMSASALGGIQHFSFATPGAIESEAVDFDFKEAGYAICLTSVGQSHEDLTDEYAAIPNEMRAVAAGLGVEILGQVSEETFMKKLPELRGTVSDRALLRAIHFYREERLVGQRVKALENSDIRSFVELTRLSGSSSAMYLQNVSVNGFADQSAMLALGISDETLSERGVCRIHGGGFGGTVQAYVPLEEVETYCEAMNRVFGADACQVFEIDHDGTRAWRL